MQQPKSAESSGQLCCRVLRNSVALVAKDSELEDSEFEESEESIVFEKRKRDIDCESDSSDEDICDGDIHPENSLQIIDLDLDNNVEVGFGFLTYDCGRIRKARFTLRLVSMKEAALEAIRENSNDKNIAAGFDGTWQKRGHVSINGVVTGYLLRHRISTDDRPKHQLCPKGEDSWCKYQKSLVTGQHCHGNN
ncbi:hypothetical protein J6590_083474 [Homalodisca vitripennis]|nr:hypothetical protein J6590_083474 [Homalodisca vitripennis]